MLKQARNISILMLIMSLVTLMGCKLSFKPKEKTINNINNTDAQAKTFILGVEQNRTRIAPDQKNCVVINKQPFRITSYFSKFSSMLVHASNTPDLYNAAFKGTPLNQLLNSGTLINEGMLNTKQQLCLRNTKDHQNWFCLGKTLNRFDAEGGFTQIPSNEGGGFLCKRTIKNLDLETRTVAVRDYPDHAIYLVFIKTMQEPGGGALRETSRQCMKILFK